MRILFISVFVAFCIFSALGEKKEGLKVRGMSPNELAALKASQGENPTTFTCKDKSKTIPFSQVNDDFCDCEDGSDEPGTSACPKGRFYCRNIGSVGKFIFSSRVGDSICDCCDGSDERENPNASCKNTCAAEAKEANKGKQQELDNTLKGLKEKQQYLEKAQREISEKKQKAQSVEAELKELRDKRNAEQEIQSRLQKEENEARDALKPKEEAKETEAPVAEEHHHHEEGEEHHHHHDEPADDAHIDQDGTVGDENNDEHYEADNEDDEAEEEEEAAARGETNPPQNNEPVDEKLAPFIEATRKQNDLVNALDNDIRQRETELEDLNKVSNFDFGNNPAFYALFGQCFKAETPEYTYELCPFDKVNQISKRGGGSTSLGTWNSGDQTDAWKTNQSEMKYTNGVRCWGGPDRSAVIKVVCGSENVLSDPAEPNKCEYSLKFATPAVCSEAQAEQLKSDLSGHPAEDDDEPKSKSGWW